SQYSRTMTTTLTVSTIADELSAPFIGEDRPIEALAPLSEAGEGALTFVVDPTSHAAPLAQALSSGAVVLAPASYASDAASGSIIFVDSPRAEFAIIVGRHFARRPVPGVATTARVDPSAEIHPSAHVGE